MLVIAKQLKMNKFVCFFCILMLFGCFYIKNSTIDSEKKLSEIEYITVDLAREVCDLDGFSLCSDGYGQSYRLYPLFVKFKKENLLSSYDTVFMFTLNDSLLNNIKEEYMFSWDMNEMFHDSLSRTPVSYESDRFCKKVETYYKNNKILKNVSCKFSYEIYKMKIKVIKGGRKEVLLPDFNAKSNSIVKRHMSEVYYIISIDEIHQLGVE